MGATEALERVMTGIISATILGAFMVGIWPTLLLFYGNTEVFFLSVVIIVMLGLIPLVFVVGIVLDSFKAFREKARKARSTFQRFQEDEE